MNFHFSSSDNSSPVGRDNQQLTLDPPRGGRSLSANPIGLGAPSLARGPSSAPDSEPITSPFTFRSVPLDLTATEVYRSLPQAAPADFEYGQDSLLGFAKPPLAVTRSLGGLSLKEPFNPDTVASALSLDQYEPPFAPGGYIEPNYHVQSSAAPTSIFQHVLDFLAQQGRQTYGVDITESDFQAFRIRCVAYRRAREVPFVVHVFSTGDTSAEGDKLYAIEFQRRSGDVMVFSEIWRATKHALQAEGVLAAAADPLLDFVARPLSPPPLPDFESPSLKAESSAIGCLLNMASSDYTDVKSQALVAVTEITSSDVKLQGRVIDNGGLDILLDSMGSSHETVHRCAMASLANLMADRPAVCETIADKTGVPALLKQRARSDKLQVVRECARVIGQLRKNVDRTRGDDILTEALDTMANHRDVAMSAFAKQMLSEPRN